MRPDSRPGKVIFCIVQIVFVIFILAPILYAVDLSILPMSQIFKKPLDIIPRKLDVSYYKRAFEMAPLFRYLLNTLLV